MKMRLLASKCGTDAKNDEVRTEEGVSLCVRDQSTDRSADRSAERSADRNDILREHGEPGIDDGRPCCEIGDTENVPEQLQLRRKTSNNELDGVHPKKRKLSHAKNTVTRSGIIRMRISVLQVQAKIANNMQKFSDKVEESLNTTQASLRFFAGVRSSVFQIQSNVTKIMAEFSEEMDAILKEVDGHEISQSSLERLSSASLRAQTETGKAMQEGLDMFDDVAQVEEAAASNRQTTI